ncbi:unnamed protein product [Amoebophrya sp. A120]|nr:unnamed protein product [Amoebophrya sp. A120]|eukprot:GSA120T00010033001.1
MDIARCQPKGRLFCYDNETKETELLKSGLYCPTAVAVLQHHGIAQSPTAQSRSSSPSIPFATQGGTAVLNAPPVLKMDPHHGPQGQSGQAGGSTGTLFQSLAHKIHQQTAFLLIAEASKLRIVKFNVVTREIVLVIADRLPGVPLSLSPTITIGSTTNSSSGGGGKNRPAGANNSSPNHFTSVWVSLAPHLIVDRSATSPTSLFKTFVPNFLQKQITSSAGGRSLFHKTSSTTHASSPTSVLLPSGANPVVSFTAATATSFFSKMSEKIHLPGVTSTGSTSTTDGLTSSKTSSHGIPKGVAVKLDARNGDVIEYYHADLFAIGAKMTNVDVPEAVREPVTEEDVVVRSVRETTDDDGCRLLMICQGDKVGKFSFNLNYGLQNYRPWHCCTSGNYITLQLCSASA